MEIQQLQWIDGECVDGEPGGSGTHQLVLMFGGREALGDPALMEAIGAWFPDAQILGCSTAGEIHGTSVADDSVSITAVNFEHTTLRGVCTCSEGSPDSRGVGRALVSQLPHEGLAHVFVISNGLTVNGSELVKGMTEGLPDDVPVTGGLAGDGADFEQTLVLWGKDRRSDSAVAAIGFYGDRIQVGYGSLGGWDPFGPQRMVTRSEGNVLYSLDGRPALDLYKAYLGEHADQLPAAGLLFPLSVEIDGTDGELVRTILAVDDATGSMTFAGDVPEGSLARLMKANFDRLIDGAADAARNTNRWAVDDAEAQLAILISCVGRKLVLKQRVEEEVEAVQRVLGPSTKMTGFYSYGEISPLTTPAACELHNQTMTITTFTEA